MDKEEHSVTFWVGLITDLDPDLNQDQIFHFSNIDRQGGKTFRYFERRNSLLHFCNDKRIIYTWIIFHFLKIMSLGIFDIFPANPRHGLADPGSERLNPDPGLRRVDIFNFIFWLGRRYVPF